MLPANSAIKRPLDRLQSADLISAWPLLHGNSLPPVRRRAFRPPQIPPPHKVRKTQLSAQSQFKCRAILLNLLPASLAIKCKTTAVAVADDGRNGEIRFHGVIENTADSVLRLTKRLVAANAQPIFCYEAGPCGYGLHRLLTKFGFACAVVSPAMIPRRAGDRIKTDRRDAEMLARLWRAGELTPVWTQDEEQEAMRDLIRTHKQSLDALKIAKQQLQSFLLRHGLRYNRPTYWTKIHWRWINELRKFRFPHQQLAFEELKRAIRQIEERIATLDQASEDAVKGWLLIIARI